MLTDEWPASSKFLFCARPGAARCSHRKKTSIAVVPDAATAKLQEMARGSHRESTQQVEKPPIANFRECCGYCKRLQDVAMLHNCKTGSQRVSRPPPLNSPSSILSKTPKLHFSIFFATLQEPVQLQPHAHSRYTSFQLKTTRFPVTMALVQEVHNRVHNVCLQQVIRGRSALDETLRRIVAPNAGRSPRTVPSAVSAGSYPNSVEHSPPSLDADWI